MKCKHNKIIHSSRGGFRCLDCDAIIKYTHNGLEIIDWYKRG